jgi:hypothetical protein
MAAVVAAKTARVPAGAASTSSAAGTIFLLAEATAEDDAISAGSVEWLEFCAGCTRVANAISWVGSLGPAAGVTVGGADSEACSGAPWDAAAFSEMSDSPL